MKYLQPVLDQAEAARLRDLMDPMILAPHLLSPCWLRKHEWVAVPIEEKPYDEGIGWICRAAQILDVRDCLVVTNDGFTEGQSHEAMGLPSVYRLKLCPEALWEVHANEHLWHFVIFPEDRSFAILQGGLCYIVAGPKTFVEAAVGGSIQRAWAEIEAVCSSELAADQPEGQILKQIIREYGPECTGSTSG